MDQATSDALNAEWAELLRLRAEWLLAREQVMRLHLAWAHELADVARRRMPPRAKAAEVRAVAVAAMQQALDRFAGDVADGPFRAFAVGRVVAALEEWARDKFTHYAFTLADVLAAERDRLGGGGQLTPTGV